MAEKVDNTSFAFYLQDEIFLFDETLFITPALRADTYEEWGTQLSPKLGVTWKFHENQRIKANFGLGFRAPSFDKLYRNSGPNFDRFGNNENGKYLGSPDLKPEESTSWDVSYEGEYKNFSTSVTYFLE